MTTAIELQGVSRRYGRATALDRVAIAVPEHSIVGLLGRNGAGKTTVMSLIAGHDRPDEGTVRVHRRDPFENASVLSEISFVRDNQRYPDDYRLHHVLRIAPEFAPNWSDDVAAELVERLRIPHRTPIKKMSRGQISAIAITLSLATRAPITLLDEPYLGLDVTARGIFHELLLRDYQEFPRTVVLSTHLIEESASLFDRIVIMDAGRVVVDEEADAMRETAWTVAGPTVSVDRAVDDRALHHLAVLRRTTVGGLSTVTFAGELEDSVRARLTREGLQLAPASIQELVAAYGDATQDQSVEV